MAEIQSQAGTSIPMDSNIHGVFVPAFLLKGGMSMLEVRNLNGKRVCDISQDGKSIEIVQKDCLTRITANPDGTLNVENIYVA